MMKSARLLRLAALLLCVLSGCKGGTASNGRGDESSSKESTAELAQFERETCVQLPADAKLLKSDDGGGRDGSYQYHLWVIHARGRIAIEPKAPAANVNVAADLDPGDVAEWVGLLLPNQSLPRALDAARATWEVGGYDYRANVLRTEQGDFMIVQRFKRPSP
jgi:hypothetical protein